MRDEILQKAILCVVFEPESCSELCTIGMYRHCAQEYYDSLLYEGASQNDDIQIGFSAVMTTKDIDMVMSQ